MKIIFLTAPLERFGGIQKYGRFLLRAMEKFAPVEKLELKEGFGNRLSSVVDFFKQISSSDSAIVVCGHINYLALAVFSKFFDKKLILFAYGIEIWNLSGFKRWLLGFTDQIVSISDFTSVKLNKQGIPLEKIFKLCPAVDGDFFRPVPPRADAPHPLILTVARLSASEKYKGYDLVVDAVAELQKEGKKVHYWIIGEGDDTERVQAKIKETGLEEQVKLLGRISEVELPSFYSTCDLFVMPSKGEGFGIVFLEAFACGKPALAGNRDASPEALDWGRLGFLTDPRSSSEIARTIRRIIFEKEDSELFNPIFLRTKVLKKFSYFVFKKRVDILLKRNE